MFPSFGGAVIRPCTVHMSEGGTAAEVPVVRAVTRCGTVRVHADAHRAASEGIYSWLVAHISLHNQATIQITSTLPSDTGQTGTGTHRRRIDADPPGHERAHRPSKRSGTAPGSTHTRTQQHKSERKVRARCQKPAPEQTSSFRRRPFGRRSLRE